MYLRFSLLFVLSIFLIGCGGSSSRVNTPNPPSIQVPTPPGAQMLGSISNVQALASCPTGFSSGYKCSQATVSCPGTADIQVTYGVQLVSGSKGTVVFHSGSGGTTPSNSGTAASYASAGYSLVNLAWASQWEDTGLAQKNVGTAACRPATIISYIFGNVAPSGAKCAQGFSGGSAALAYALAWYGADSYLDKVQLVSGPVFSDIALGCQVPPPPPVTVCPPGQFGCQPGDTFQASLSYLSGAATLAGQISGDASCGQSTPTSTASATNWKAQSIVDGTSKRSFTHPKTSISGWVCDNGLNNSGAQGNIYFQQFTSASQALSFLVVPVNNCSGAEGTEAGFTPSGVDVPTAMLSDMTDPVQGCVLNH
jgi:hypothetical protein